MWSYCRMTDEMPAIEAAAIATIAGDKPLGIKAYGHIPHLPGSRMGPGDHMIEVGQARIAQYKVRDKNDRVIVQEKLDGSCVSVAKVNGELIPLSRAGYRAVTSKYEQHILFHDWAMAHWDRFNRLLQEGERVVGEWLAQAHGTRYDLEGVDPFVPFDLMRGSVRATWAEASERTARLGFSTPAVINDGVRPITAEEAMLTLRKYGFYGAKDPVEGAVWRVERRGAVDFLAKYVRPDKVDGLYLPETAEAVTAEPIWNWRP